MTHVVTSTNSALNLWKYVDNMRATSSSSPAKIKIIILIFRLTESPLLSVRRGIDVQIVIGGLVQLATDA